jgi:beta-phosphoglucomutase-like phosphatase (HAD superfamily)
MGRIKAIITDFDGTLVNTFHANFYAYHEVFKQYGYELTRDQYKECYGLRYDAFCDKMNIKQEDRKPIKELKKKIYPDFFDYLTINQNLLTFIRASHILYGIKTCIASTATKENLYNVLKYFNIEDAFDVIITGENVSKGKPDPEVYLKAMNVLECKPDEAIVFEDSDVGCKAAENAGLNYIKVKL